MASETRALEALLRNDFRAFLRKVFATLSPGQTYVPTWHVEAIAWQLERVRARRGPPTDHQYASSIAKIDSRLGCLSGIRPRA